MMLGGGNPGNGFIYFPDFWDIIQVISNWNIYLSIYPSIYLSDIEGKNTKVYREYNQHPYSHIQDFTNINMLIYFLQGFFF